MKPLIFHHFETSHTLPVPNESKQHIRFQGLLWRFFVFFFLTYFFYFIFLFISILASCEIIKIYFREKKLVFCVSVTMHGDMLWVILSQKHQFTPEQSVFMCVSSCSVKKRQQAWKVGMWDVSKSRHVCLNCKIYRVGFAVVVYSCIVGLRKWWFNSEEVIPCLAG